MNPKEQELLEKMKAVIAENEMLKAKNMELKKLIAEQQNWKGIREGEIIPRLRERYGEGNSCFSTMATYIANIVKDLVDCKKITEINETNYEEARQITIALTETICKFEWKHLSRAQSIWKENGWI